MYSSKDENKDALNILKLFQSIKEHPKNKYEAQERLFDHFEQLSENAPPEKKLETLKLELGALNYLSWELANEPQDIFSTPKPLEVQILLRKSEIEAQLEAAIQGKDYG